jgi:DNA-binding phage protein
MGHVRVVEVAVKEVETLAPIAVALQDLRDAAFVVARAEISDAITEALRADGRGLREIARDTGLDPAFLSRLTTGKHSPTLASVALVALALGKKLKISIE